MWKQQFNVDQKSYLLWSDGWHTFNSHKKYNEEFLNPAQKDTIVQSVRCDLNVKGSGIICAEHGHVRGFRCENFA